MCCSTTLNNNLLWNLHPVMTFKVLALVVEQFWHDDRISYCKKHLVRKCEISGNCLQKIGVLDLSLIKLLQNLILLQNQWRCNFLPHSVEIFNEQEHCDLCHALKSCVNCFFLQNVQFLFILNAQTGLYFFLHARVSIVFFISSVFCVCWNANLYDAKLYNNNNLY